MNKETAFIFVLVGIFLLGLILMVLQTSKKYKIPETLRAPQRKHTPAKKSKPSSSKKTVTEGFINLGHDFYIYNYLSKIIKIYSNTTLSEINPSKPSLIATISPHSRKGFPKKDIEQYLKRNSKFSVYIVGDENSSGEKKSSSKECEYLFSEYELDVPEGETIKMLHVGMVTSKWVGSDGDSSISPGNAIQGLPWIKIHNMTDYPLSINNNINISPRGTLRYSGRDNFGVRLGTVFKDQNSIFDDFIFTTPATDIYYGVVSDIQQALFGGFQLTEKFIDSTYEPQNLLEGGWQGGAAYPRIPYGFIPTEGKPVPPQNRWGEPATKFNVENPVGPPPELNLFMTLGDK